MFQLTWSHSCWVIWQACRTENHFCYCSVSVSFPLNESLVPASVCAFSSFTCDYSILDACGQVNSLWASVSSASNRDNDSKHFIWFLLYGSSKFTKENLKSSSLSCTTLSSSSLFFVCLFFKSQRRKIISFQRFHLSDLPAPAKTCPRDSAKK